MQNWNPSDGPPPLPGGWCDAWQELFPGSPGLTYDPKRSATNATCRLLHWMCKGGSGICFQSWLQPAGSQSAANPPRAPQPDLACPCSNPMLKHGNRIRRRLDRAFCRLRRWRLQSAELVGREPLPGLSFEGRPVLPSDHFGLLLMLRPT